MSYDMIKPSDLEFLVADNRDEFKRNRMEMKKNRFKSVIKANKSILASDMENCDCLDTLNRMIDVINERRKNLKLPSVTEEDIKNGYIISGSGKRISLKNIVNRTCWYDYGIKVPKKLKDLINNKSVTECDGMCGCDGMGASENIEQDNNQKPITEAGKFESNIYKGFNTPLGSITYKFVGTLSKDAVDKYFEKEDSLNEKIAPANELQKKIKDLKYEMRSSQTGDQTQEKKDRYNRAAEQLKQVQSEYDKIKNNAQLNKQRLNEMSHKSLDELNYKPEDIQQTTGMSLLLDKKDNVLVSVLVFGEDKKVAKKVYSKKDFSKDGITYKTFVEKTKEWCKKNGVADSLTEGVSFSKETGFEGFGMIKYTFFETLESDVAEEFVNEHNINVEGELVGVSVVTSLIGNDEKLLGSILIYNNNGQFELSEPVVGEGINSNDEILNIFKQITERSVSTISVDDL